MTTLTPQDAKPESPLREILELRMQRDQLRAREKALVEAVEAFIDGVPDNAAFRVGYPVSRLRAALSKVRGA